MNDNTLMSELRGQRLEQLMGDHERSSDMVYRPPHYAQYADGMEPMTFFLLNNLPFAEASVCKYVLRWRKKNGIEDLRKAMRVIEMMIELEENRDKYKPQRSML